MINSLDGSVTNTSLSSLNGHSDKRTALLIAAAASEPEANERGSSLISRRLHYRGLQSLFFNQTQGIVVMRKSEI